MGIALESITTEGVSVRRHSSSEGSFGVCGAFGKASRPYEGLGAMWSQVCEC